MTLWLPPSQFGYLATNLTAADRNGATITASGTAHTEGSWTSLIDPLPEDIYAIAVKVGGISISATVTSFLIDIGAGPTGGGSEYVVIEDLDCWGAQDDVPRYYYFPVFVPSGERLSGRGQALIVNDTANVSVWVYAKPAGNVMEPPTMWERLGTVTNSNGVSVTPGSGAFGSWTTILDPITKNYRWWHVGYDGLADISQNASQTLVQVGIGPDTSNVSVVGEWEFSSNASEQIAGPFPSEPVFQPLPDDDANGVFARIASSATEARGILVYAAE